MVSTTRRIPTDGGQVVRGRSLGREAGRRLVRNRAALFSLALLATIVLLTLMGPLLTSHPYDEIYWDRMAAPPDLGAHFYFGTDANGRDLFVRTLYGGRIDGIMMRLVDVLYALPFMFFVILLMVYFGRSIFLIFIAIGAVEWLTMARIVRGQALSLKDRAFVEAAQVCGATSFTIIRRHIIPNALGPVIVYATLTVPQVILFESFLSFLGLGVQEPMTSWGVLIAEGAQQMESAPWTLLFPAVFLATTLFCLNFLGDGLRDALDPKDR